MSNMMTKKVLVVGLGIGGMATAIALKQKGWDPVIIERTTHRRTGGYFIGFQAVGKEAAAKLGVLSDIHVRTPEVLRNWDLLADGSRICIHRMNHKLMKPTAVLRGDIEAGLWRGIEKEQIEVRYDDTPIKITDLGDEVKVTLQKGSDQTQSTEFFNLVVGSDGVRSTVRKLVFGPHEQFLKYTGSMICAF